MRQNDIEVAVLVNGNPITEYYHVGQHFVEGRAGSDFEIQVKNHARQRVEAVISVDGLSITDGKEAGPNSSGYLLNAGETIRIPGWKLDAAAVAKFVFAAKGKAYATQSTGSARNTGVIGVMVFNERSRPVYRQPTFRSMRDEWQTRGGSMGLETLGSNPTTRGGGQMFSMGIADASLASMDWMDQDQPRGIACSASSASVSTHVENSLGTGFGKKEDFQTTTVSFERSDMRCLMVLYYDDSKGLRQRGIVLTKPSRQAISQQPQAFPGMSGCTPPPGWKG